MVREKYFSLVDNFDAVIGLVSFQFFLPNISELTVDVICPRLFYQARGAKRKNTIQTFYVIFLCYLTNRILTGLVI